MTNPKFERDTLGAVFKDAATTATRTLGRNTQVNLVFAGTDAFTDGKTIVMPALDGTATLTPHEASGLRGYYHHETAHIRHTDMPAFEREVEEAKKAQNEPRHHFLNAIEDYRIEREYLKDYPVHADLTTAHDEVNAELMQAIKDDPSLASQPHIVGPAAVTWRLMQENGISEDSAKAAYDLVDDKIRQVIEKYVPAIKQCQTTSDTIRLARALTKDMEPPEKSDDDQGDGQGQGNGQGGGGGQGGPGNQQGQGQGGAGQQGQGNGQQGQQGGKGQGGQPGDANAPGNGAGGDGQRRDRPLDTSLDPKDFMPKENNAPDQDNNSFTLEKHVLHRISDRSDEISEWLRREEGRAYYAQLMAKARNKVPVMRNKLERLLQAKRARDWRGGYEQGRLDSKRLVAAYTGAPLVYRQRESAEDLNTAVTVLIDASDSMNWGANGGAQVLAAVACGALMEVLMACGIPCQVASFGQMGHTGNQANNEIHRLMKARKKALAGLTNGQPDPNAALSVLDLCELKGFNDPLNTARLGIGNYQRVVDGGTPMGEAMVTLMPELLARPEERKIMFVLTDGQPNDPNITVRARKALEKAGVDVVGIGIGQNIAEHLFPRNATVSSAEDLAKATMDHLGKALLGKTFRSDNADLAA